jgi:hypothetical protein
VRFLVVASFLPLAFGCGRDEKSAPPAPISTSESAVPVATPPVATPSASPAPPRPSAAASSRPGVAPAAGTLRLVFATEPDALPPAAQVDTLKTWIEKGGAKTDAAPATDAERAYAKALPEHTDTPPPLPEAWSGFETVVLLRIEPARGSASPKRSGGRTHLVIVRPPAREPVFSTIYTERSQTANAAAVDAGRLGAWIQMHLTLREKGRAP